MKKILIGTLLLIGATTGLIGSIKPLTAEAAVSFMESKPTKNLPGSDTWTRGIKTPGNGWYLTYSYYYNSAYNHNASVYTKQHSLKSSDVAGPGITAMINAPSVPDYAGAYTRAGVQTGNTYKNVWDEGYGERTSKP